MARRWIRDWRTVGWGLALAAAAALLYVLTVPKQDEDDVDDE